MPCGHRGAQPIPTIGEARPDRHCWAVVRVQGVFVPTPVRQSSRRARESGVAAPERRINKRAPAHRGAGALPALSSDIFLDIDRVTFGYDERVILSDVSLQFKRGSVTAIMGGSGCGKTTLLRLIGGTVKPQHGRITLDGQPIDPDNRDALYGLRRRIGMLFQFGALFTDLTLFENVAFPLREHTKLPEAMIRDIVVMKLHAVGLRGAAELKPNEISGGMARRVALARTIALDPELIMYDEPFAGLDPISLGVAANLIRRLNDATGATSLIVSHDVHECFLICDYAYLISSGRVVAHGTPDQLRASDEPEVRQFIRGEADGPVRFHYPAPPVEQDFGVSA